MSSRHMFARASTLATVALLVSTQSDAAVAPTRVQVTADEFRLALSRSSIRSGPAVVELLNLGEDDHDLALRRVAQPARTYRLATTRPGSFRRLSATLAPGRYRLWCTLADHRARGMAATLVVRGQ